MEIEKGITKWNAIENLIEKKNKEKDKWLFKKKINKNNFLYMLEGSIRDQKLYEEVGLKKFLDVDHSKLFLVCLKV